MHPQARSILSLASSPTRRQLPVSPPHSVKISHCDQHRRSHKHPNLPAYHPDLAAVRCFYKIFGTIFASSEQCRGELPCRAMPFDHYEGVGRNEGQGKVD